MEPNFRPLLSSLICGLNYLPWLAYLSIGDRRVAPPAESWLISKTLYLLLTTEASSTMWALSCQALHITNKDEYQNKEHQRTLALLNSPLVQPRRQKSSPHDWKIVDWAVKHQNKQTLSVRTYVLYSWALFAWHIKVSVYPFSVHLSHA